MRLLKTVIILVIIVLFSVVFFWLLDREFVFRGFWSTETDFNKISKLIHLSSSAEKIKENKKVFLRSKTEDISFQAATSRKFEEGTVTAEFRPNGAPVVKLGVLAQKDPWQVKEKTVYNEYLDGLDWASLVTTDSSSGQEQGLKLWQRRPQFKSVEDFLKNPPALDKIMVVDYDSRWPVKLSNYYPSIVSRIYNLSLRGPQTIWTYLQGENLNWHFYFQDVNRHDGQDNFLVRVSNLAGQIVCEKEIEDDGDLWASGKLSDLREFGLNEKLPDGVYKIQITAPDDIFIRKFATSQNKFVFQYVLYLGDMSGYANPSPVKVFAKAQELNFRTPHQEGRQPLKINGETINIERENQDYPFKARSNLTQILVPYPDLKIDFDGFVSLAPELFFLPKPLGFQDAGGLAAFGVNYILAADYNPVKIGDWIYGQVNLKLDNVAQDSGLTLTISLDKFQINQTLDVSNIKIDLKRSPFDFKRLPGIIFSKLKNFLRQIS